MAVDRSSEFVIGFSGDQGNIDDFLSGLKTKFRSAVTEIEQTTKKVVLFGELETKTQASAAALETASTKARALAAQLDAVQAAGGKATADLTQGLKSANREVDTATTAFNRNVDALSKLQNTLARAGVDTQNLAREQLRLAEAHRTAAAAQAEQTAKQLLGVKTLADITPQIQRINAAYLTLKESGALSAKELDAAYNSMNARLKETNAQVGTVATGFKAAAGETRAFYNAASAQFLAITAAIGGAVAAFAHIVEQAHAFENGMARINSVTNLSKEQLEELGASARKAARDLGLDLPEALKAIFDLVRSGVSPDNAIEVLRRSAEAAKTSFATLDVGVKVSSLLLNTYKVDVKDLGESLALIVVGAKNGGASLQQFAEGGAQLLGLAKAVNLPLNEMVALLTVMSKRSGDAGESMTVLGKVLAKLETAAVRDKLHALGVETDSVIHIFQQIQDRHLSLDEILGLGIVAAKSPGAIAALTALMGNAKELAPELDKLRDASKQAGEALVKALDTPVERSKRFQAALKDAEVSIGETAGSGGRLGVALTKVLNVFNDLTPSVKRTVVEQEQLQSAVGPLGAIYSAAAIAVDFFTSKQEEAQVATKKAADAATEAAKRFTDLVDPLIEKSKQDLALIGPRIVAAQKELEALATAAIAHLNARAAEEIAALDKSTKAQADTAAKTITIQTKLASDRLAIIQKNEADVAAAADASVARFRAATVRTADEQKIIEENVAKTRIAALGTVLAQYQEHYKALIGEAQGYAAKINSIESERISFNEGIEKRLFDIRISGFGALDQYAAKTKEIDRLIAEARQAGVEGDIKSAKKYTDEAIALSGTLTTVINKDGATVVSALEVQQRKINDLKTARDTYNEALGKEKALAKEGEDASVKAANDVLPKIQELQKTYDDLQASVAKGLEVKLTKDEQSFRDVQAALDELTAARTVVIRTVTEDGTPAPAPRGDGGFVGQPQGFASGGAVFRRPTWDKVPGSGNTDTVPAALQAGSFVLRKAASQQYGDGILSRLAHGFASGGGVGDGLWAKMQQGYAQIRHFASGGDAGDDIIARLRAQRLASPADRSLHDFKIEAEDVVGALLEQAKLLKQDSNGQNFADYLAVVLGHIDGARNLREAHYWADPIIDPAVVDRMQASMQNAQRFNVGIVMGALTGGGAAATPVGKGGNKPTKPEFTNAFNLPADPVSAPSAKGMTLLPILDFLAGGGRVGDTIPAMLTPGEYVFRPEAVQAITRMFGGGMLPAMNAMRVPSSALSGMLNPYTPPRVPVARFAEGGPVGSVAGASNGPGAFGGGGITVNIQVDGSDLLSEENIYRKFFPVFDKINRLSGRK